MAISLNAYTTKGYQILPGLLPKERVSAVREFLQGRLTSAIDTLKPLGIHADLQHLSRDIRNLLATPGADTIDRDLRATMRPGS